MFATLTFKKNSTFYLAAEKLILRIGENAFPWFKIYSKHESVLGHWILVVY